MIKPIHGQHTQMRKRIYSKASQIHLFTHTHTRPEKEHRSGPHPGRVTLGDQIPRSDVSGTGNIRLLYSGALLMSPIHMRILWEPYCLNGWARFCLYEFVVFTTEFGSEQAAGLVGERLSV